MKIITVTQKNINSFLPYQGNDKLKLKIGDTLEVVREKIPKTFKKSGSNYFAIVTDYSGNGHNRYTQTAYEPTIKNSFAFNRWSIDQNLMPKIV